MRLRNITGSREVIADSIYVVHDIRSERLGNSVDGGRI